MLSIGGLKSIGGSLAALAGHISYAPNIIYIGGTTSVAGTESVAFNQTGGISIRNSQSVSIGTSGAELIQLNGANGLVSSAAASGNNAFLVSVSGGRVKLSSAGTTDYFTSDGATKITAAGALAVADSFILTSFTDDSANTGNRTVNKVRGFNAFAAAGTAITITNSFVTTSSQIVATIMTNDATGRLANVVPASGSFTINLTAAATGTTKVAWTVIN